jgi:TrmH family RNA methyltransferase
VEGALLGPGSVDPYNPKVARGSMGALLRLPVRPATWEEIGQATAGIDVWLAAARDGMTYTAVDWRRPAALLIGGEARGAGADAERLAKGRVTIPMRDETESLNAALAAGILLFEAARQREEDSTQRRKEGN